MLCPLCLDYTLTQRSERNSLYYKGRYKSVILEYSNCPVCGDQEDPEQVKRNKDIAKEFMDSVDDNTFTIGV